MENKTNISEIKPLCVMPLTQNIIDWLRDDETIISTLTLVSAFTGIMFTKRISHPFRFNHFKNLFELIEKEPILKEKIHCMKFIDKNWKIISENFAHINDWYNSVLSLKDEDSREDAIHIFDKGVSEILYNTKY